MADLIAQLNEQKLKVDFDTFDISVRELIGMVNDHLIDIAPDYQRQFRWDDERESTFVESVFLGIPIPSLFMATNSDATWELIDGVQRLSTLIHFVGDIEGLQLIGKPKPLEISELEKLSTFNGSSFTELPKAVQLQFMLKPLKVTTLSDKSDSHVRFDLFERLNTGGVLLTAQEIRACIYRGQFNETLRDLAANEDFMKIDRMPRESEVNGTRAEHVLRFFAFLNRYKTFNHSVKDFLNDYMGVASKRFDYKANIELFNKVFLLLGKALPNGITRGRGTTPVNLYEAVSVGAALALQQSSSINTKGIYKWMRSPDLRRWTTGATNSRTMVLNRIHFARDQFLLK